MIIPSLKLPIFPLEPTFLASYIVLGISIVAFAIFWIWAIIHAARTPRATWSQRLLWSLCILLNPSSTIWYWCIWKRWAFWSLFTPMLGFFVAFPFVIRSLMSKADATALTNGLFLLGSNGFVIFIAILLIYPVILRLIVTLDLTVNQSMNAMERNDWVLSLGMPVIGFGTAFVYAVRNLKTWAFLSLAWILTFTTTLKIIAFNLVPLLIPTGEQRREQFLENRPPPWQNPPAPIYKVKLP